MKHYSHLNTAVQLLRQYQGEQPFGNFIKHFFKQHKKYGSKDRKNITQLCYAYFRLGKALPDLPVEERILIGLFLCSQEPNELLANLKPEWNEQVGLTLGEKWSLVNRQSSIVNSEYFDQTVANVFPWEYELSPDIDYHKFCTSFFIQPDLFLRLRPGQETVVKSKLLKAGIAFNDVDTSCLALPNTSKVEDVIDINTEAVIQDYSSQRVGELLEMVKREIPTHRRNELTDVKLKTWDCCAASGGKSIMAYDILERIDLTVSDIRPSILKNLEKRFAQAGIKEYSSFVADLASPTSVLKIGNSKFDIIIADVPCSGSGTWSRTPEQLAFFEERLIHQYSTLQKKIISNVLPYLEQNGWLLYITCSVFKKENEEVVAFIRDNFNVKVYKAELLQGYSRKADTLFAALIQKNSDL